MVDAVLSTIRIGRADASGCAATLDEAAGTPSGPADVLVPDSPTSAVRCAYESSPNGSGLLVGSSRLDATKAGQLTTALNELVPDPCHCVHGGTPEPGHDEVLYFRYRDGSTLRIVGHLGADLDSYTNQSRTVADYDGSIGRLLSQLTNRH